MKKKLQLIFIILFFLLKVQAYAQFGPSLSLGISEVTYERGKLNAELIAEIIAKKQSEIKTEVAKRLILNRLEVGSFTLWNFANQNLQILFNQTDPNIISKEMIKNAAELAMVYGISEYYLRMLKIKEPEDLNGNQRKFLEEYEKWLGASKKEIKKSVKSKSEALDTGYTIRLPSEEKAGNYLAKPTFIIQKNNRIIEKKNKFVQANHIFLDLVYDVCKNSEALQSIGFFQNINVSEDTYRNQSKFFYWHKDSTLRKNFELVRPELDLIIKTVAQFYNTIKFIIEHKSGDTFDIQAIIDKTSPKIELMSSFQAVLKNNIKKINLDVSNFDKDLIRENQELFMSLYQLISNKKLEEKPERAQEEHFLLKKYFLPKINALAVISNDTTLDLVADHLDKLERKLQIELLESLQKKLSNSNIKIKDLTGFVRVIDVLNELDRVESYDYIFKFIAGIGETYTNPGARKIINSIANVYDRYAELLKEENKIKMDVEAIAVDLFKEYGENNNSPVGIYFSVGINSALTNKPEEFIEGGKTESISFISEKVGLRVNIVDFDRKKMLDDSKYNKPIISNIFIFGYFSGLLYQLDALKTEDDFDKTLYGLGGGISFFNNLDLNLSYAVPFGNQFNQGMFNLGFDIKITEYLNQLGKKRREKKN